MTTKDEALKLELQRIRSIVGQVTGLDDEDEDNLRDAYKSIDRVIDSLAEQPAQQEPVAWHGYDLDGMVEAFDRVIQAHYNSKQPFHSPVDSDAQMALRILRGFIPSMKRYTSPPASKPWVGLTDEEIKRMAAPWFLSMYWPLCNTFARAIEAKLKDKNGY